MIRPVDARFVTTAVAPEGYPRGGLPEIAFVGRSNVGKSSMINAITGRRKLVRVSNTPGRTRTLNFFDVDLLHDEELAQGRSDDDEVRCEPTGRAPVADDAPPGGVQDA